MPTSVQRERIRAAVGQTLRKRAQAFQSRMVKERLSGPRPGKLGRRTGAAASAVKARVEGANTDRPRLVAFVERRAFYLKIHETGGTIRAKRARNLAIPVGPALTKAGVSKNTSPRKSAVPLMFWISRKGNKLLVEARTQSSGVKQLKFPMKVHYVLKRQVTIPARLGFREMFEEEARKAREAVAAEVRKVSARMLRGS